MWSNVVNSNSHSMPTQKPGPDPRVSGPPRYRTLGHAEESEPRPRLGNRKQDTKITGHMGKGQAVLPFPFTSCPESR